MKVQHQQSGLNVVWDLDADSQVVYIAGLGYVHARCCGADREVEEAIIRVSPTHYQRCPICLTPIRRIALQDRPNYSAPPVEGIHFL